MARRGSRKVRTGCLTCKIRKVKCDERKPICERCTSGHRKCDGYAPPTIYTALAIYRPRQALPGIHAASERRALQFFRETAGPFLSGATDPQFWMRLVMQFSCYEPAVRHSVVAISALYEQFNAEAEGDVRLRDNPLALRHYNAAIHELKTMDSPAVVLLVCILFTCIECLQSNREAAITHCKSGIAIMENATSVPSWAKEHLRPIFRRLSMLPFFFGNSSDDVPNLIAWDESVPIEFCSFSDAQTMMDDIFCRTVRLVRWGDAHRIGNLRHQPVSLELLAEQEKIRSLLEQWLIMLANFEAGLASTGIPVIHHFKLGDDCIKEMIRGFLLMRHEICRISRYQPASAGLLAEQERIRTLLEQWQLLSADFDVGLTSLTTATKHFKLGEDFIKEMLRGFLLMRHEICRIWSEMAFSADETGYDAYLDSFRWLIARAQTLNTTVPDAYRMTTKSAKFIFETGVIPMLFFIAIKCRCLDTRLEALRLMKILGIARENLWEVSTTHGVGRRVIEIEHDVLLDESDRPSAPALRPGLPPDEMRVRDTSTEPKASVHTSMRGFEIRGRIVGFFMRTADDTIYLHTEFLASEGSGVSPGRTRPKVPIRRVTTT
ncbi:C6 zinc finger domain protein [Ilyonectria robusta]